MNRNESETLKMNAREAESIVREKMKTVFGVDNLEIYERTLENGKWHLTVAFFPTRGSDYEEIKRCSVDESGEISWKHE